MTGYTNDYRAPPEAARARGADEHGQAAMLLVESLIHGLVDRSVISVAEAVEIVDVAADTQAEIADPGGPPAAPQSSLAMLHSISSSLRHDMPRGANDEI